jgi:hypothetical protein
MRNFFLLIFSFYYLLLNGQDNETTYAEQTDYKTITFNGIWSWFSDPRAIYFEGKYKRTYIGWIDNFGDVHVGFYDHGNKKIDSYVIYDGLEIDDHNNPSILIDHEGYLHLFFTAHLQNEKPIYYIKSSIPEDISSWEDLKLLYLNDKEKYPKAVNFNHTYTNPIQLKSENNKIFLFWRGVNISPTYSISTDNGSNWVSGDLLFLPDGIMGKKTPYTKVYSNGESKIHFTFTDSHPLNSDKNQLYYTYYENGNFYKANGKKIKGINQLPLKPSELDLVYISDSEKVWNWDIAEDNNGNPVLGFVTFEGIENHIYNYSLIEDDKWVNRKLINSGNWFPEDQNPDTQPEPYYSGGMTINHTNPNILYLSIKKEGIFEIEKWTTKNKGLTWIKKEITKNSKKNNVRPYAIKNIPPSNDMQLLWLQIEQYVYYSSQFPKTDITFNDRYNSSIKSDLLLRQTPNKNLEEKLIDFSSLLMDYNLSTNTIEYNSWIFGLFFKSLSQLSEISTNSRYQAQINNILQYDEEENEDFEYTDFQLIWNYNDNLERIYNEQLNGIDINQYNMLKPVDFALLIQLSTKIEDATKKNKIYNTLKINSDKIKDFILSKTDKNSSIYSKSLALYAYYWLINNNLIVIENNVLNDTILELNKIFNILEQKFNANTEMLDFKTNSVFILAVTEFFKHIKN